MWNKGRNTSVVVSDIVMSLHAHISCVWVSISSTSTRPDASQLMDKQIKDRFTQATPRQFYQRPAVEQTAALIEWCFSLFSTRHVDSSKAVSFSLSLDGLGLLHFIGTLIVSSWPATPSTIGDWLPLCLTPSHATRLSIPTLTPSLFAICSTVRNQRHSDFPH